MSIEKYRDTSIDHTRISEELEKQAANYLFVAEKAIYAEVEYDLYKQKVSELEAMLDESIRATAEGKITERFIDKEILRNEEYQKAMARLIRLKGAMNVMKALKDSWYGRKDLLIQLAIKERAEMDALISDRVKEKVA